MFDKEVFAYRLKSLREEKHLNQSECAQKLGISRGSMSFYEHGERLPDIEIIYNMAHFFKVTSDYLIGISNIKTNDANINSVCKYLNLTEETVDRLRFNMENTFRDDLPYWDLFYDFKDGKYVELPLDKKLLNIPFEFFYKKALDSFLFSRNFDELIQAMALSRFYDHFVASLYIADDKTIKEMSISDERLSKLISFKDNYKRFCRYEIIDALNSVNSYTNYYNPLNSMDKEIEIARNKKLDEVVEKIKKSKNN